jgi:hypothetical protein
VLQSYESTSVIPRSPFGFIDSAVAFPSCSDRERTLLLREHNAAREGRYGIGYVGPGVESTCGALFFTDEVWPYIVKGLASG